MLVQHLQDPYQTAQLWINLRRESSIFLKVNFHHRRNQVASASALSPRSNQSGYIGVFPPEFGVVREYALELQDKPAVCTDCGRPRSRLTHFDWKLRIPVTTEVLWCANPRCKHYGRRTMLGRMTIRVMANRQRQPEAL